MIQGRSNAWAVGTTIIEANKRLGYPSRESVSAHCIQTGPIGHPLTQSAAFKAFLTGVNDRCATENLNGLVSAGLAG